MEVDVGGLRALLAFTDSPDGDATGLTALEAGLGVRLVEPGTAGPVPTRAARDLVPLARDVVRAADRLAAWCESAGAERVLRVGFPASGAGPATRPVLRAARRELPEVRLELRHLDWTELLPALVAGRLDVALVWEPPADAGLRRVPVWSEPKVLAVPLGHPLAAAGVARPADLADLVFLVDSAAEDGWLDRWLGGHRRGPVSGGTEELLARCAAGAGVVLTVASMLDFHRRPGTVAVPLADTDHAHLELCVRDESDDPLTSRFVDVVSAVVAGATGHGNLRTP